MKAFFDWLCASAAIGCAVFAIWSFILGMEVRSLRAEVTEKRTELAKGQTFTRVNKGLIELLARAAAQTDDAAITELLKANGVTFKVRRDGAAVPAPETPEGAGE